MTRVFLLRHGETKWNIEKVFRGRSEIPLNDTGRRQAELAAAHLKPKDIHFIYTSPLSRAKETADICGRILDLRPVVDEHFTGLAFGPWQGKPHTEIKEKFPDLYKVYKDEFHNLKLEGAETLQTAFDRCMSGLADIEKKHPDSNVLIVSHRVICKLMILGILGQGPAAFYSVKLDTCGLSEFYTNEGRWVLMKFNDTCFLGDSARVGGDF